MLVSTFVAKFLSPVVKDIQKYSKPIQPIVDTVTTPIPGISELYQALGKPPGHMLPWSHWSRPQGPDERVQHITANLLKRALA